jgi:hypothetical protein
LITKFEINALKNSILIEINNDSKIKSFKGEDLPVVTDREEIIMKKYMLFSLKHAIRKTIKEEIRVEEKCYLLKGKFCYYLDK